jgi:hypothetical protein
MIAKQTTPVDPRRTFIGEVVIVVSPTIIS